MSKKLNTRNKRVLAGLLALVLPAIILFTIHKQATADTQAEEIFYSSPSLEGDFADDTVLIVLNKEASRSFKTYTLEDFPEGIFSQVDDLTEFNEEFKQKQLKLNAEEMGDWSKLKPYLESSMLIDAEKFRKIVSAQ